MSKFESEQITLPDGTEVYVHLKDDEIEYIVDDPDADSTEESIYTAEEALEQALEIRRREMRSWDTIYPEEAEPVLDVARALQVAAVTLDPSVLDDEGDADE